MSASSVFCKSLLLSSSSNEVGDVHIISLKQHLDVAAPSPALKLVSYAPNYSSMGHLQQAGANKLHSIRCHSLRLGAAEEGVSSWEDKLDSTSNTGGDLLEGANSGAQESSLSSDKGEADNNQRNLALDEEGNIDNIEQEQADYAGMADNDVEMEGRKHSSNATDHVLSNTDSSLKSQQRPCESSVEVGDKGEFVVKTPQSLPLQEVDLSVTKLNVLDRLGWSEASCDEGSHSRTNTEGEEVQMNKLQQLEEEVFQGDGGRTPEDYHRRADLFGRSAEQFAARKQRDDSHDKQKCGNK
ncbi:hypothetical protein L7F22_002405 [Adiantum nelumboides]|nr:hypothetical protein [Adiantum nelumboides]